MKNRFRFGTMFAAIAAMFGGRETQKIVTPDTPDHDEYHHPRNKHSGTGRAFIRQYRRHRNVRNEMAFQSRKRNRAA
jgi:hypothetical protein